MILRVDPNSAVPVYEQLRVQITNMATAGTLAPGAQLPTAETDVIRVSVSFTKDPAVTDLESFKATFKNPARAYLLDRRPPPPSTNDLIERVQSQLEQIRLNQLR